MFGVKSRDHPDYPFAAIAAIMAATYSIAGQFEYPAALPLCIGFFLIGVSTRCWLDGTSLPRLLPALLVAAGNLMFYTVAYGYGRVWVGLLPVLIWGAMVWYMHQMQSGQRLNLVGRGVDIVLANKVAVTLGRWSYATYLLHIPMFVAVLWLGSALGLTQTRTTYFIELVAACPALILFSGLAHHWIEQPGVALGNVIAKRFKVRRPEGAGPLISGQPLIVRTGDVGQP